MVPVGPAVDDALRVVNIGRAVEAAEDDGLRRVPEVDAVEAATAVGLADGVGPRRLLVDDDVVGAPKGVDADVGRKGAARVGVVPPPA